MEIQSILNQTAKKISYRKDKALIYSGNTLIKLFDNSYSKSNVLNEALNQSRVEETGLNIPKIHEVTLINGQWAIVMDLVCGQTLEQLMINNPEREDEYMELFVKIHRDVHSRKHMLLTKFSDKLISKILNSELDASTRYDLSIKLNDMPKGSSVCHGDFNPSNVILKDDGTPFIIDWSHASQGNLIADVTKTYMLFKLNGEDLRAEKYLDEYARQSDIDKNEVFKWIPLVSAGQLVRNFGEKKRKLMEWINRVDY